jgi:hypothetical protein
MDLTVLDASGERAEQVSVPGTVPVRRIVDRLAELWQLPSVGPDGRSISYRFEHEPDRRPLDNSLTLSQGGVAENDVLRLVAYAVPPTDLSAPAYGSLESPTSAPQAPSLGPPSGYASHPVQLEVEVDGSRRALFVSATAIALIGAGVVVLLTTGTLSGASHGRGSTSTGGGTSGRTESQAQSTPSTPSESEQSKDRSAILALVGEYQSAYSAHSLPNLSALLTPEVSRRGLATGGCTVSHGRSAVLADYRAQFEQGSGSYELVGLSEGQIELESATQAHLNAHYKITPGGSGYVGFRFEDLSEAWKISEIYASCE